MHGCLGGWRRFRLLKYMARWLSEVGKELGSAEGDCLVSKFLRFVLDVGVLLCLWFALKWLRPIRSSVPKWV